MYTTKKCNYNSIVLYTSMAAMTSHANQECEVLLAGSSKLAGRLAPQGLFIKIDIRGPTLKAGVELRE